MALIFLGVLTVFTVSSFKFSPCQIAVTSLPVMSIAAISTDFTPLDYQAWEQC